MDVKYIGGDEPWTLPFGDHFYSASQTSIKSSHVDNEDLQTIARRYDFHALSSLESVQSQKKIPFPDPNTKWMNAGVFFTDHTIEPDYSPVQPTEYYEDHGHTFCYLCSINAHDHPRTQPRPLSQRRKPIPYNNPKALKPRPASADRTRPPAPIDNLVPYRFIVRTGSRPDGGTRAQVYLYMYGTENNWTSIHLSGKNNSSSIDGFPSGSIRTFCLKGPDIGVLHHLNVNLIGARSERAWFLNEIEITNLKTSVIWLCQFNCWLPKKHEENPVKPTIERPTLQPISTDNLTVYMLQIQTGGKAFAGTDSNIGVHIRGSISETKAMALTSNQSDLFEQNQLDTFLIVGWDLGELNELIVTSDNSQMASDWDLKEMIIWKILPHDESIPVYFPFNQWLGEKTKRLKSKAEIYRSKDYRIRGPTCYFISVKTGSRLNAGTDANVYIQIYGKHARTTIHLLDNPGKNDFERGATSNFMIMDIDVGSIERIRIWHDNAGPSPGWYLDSIIIRKKHSLSRTVSKNFIERVELFSKILYNQAKEKIEKEHRQKSREERESMDRLGSGRSVLRSPSGSERNSVSKKRVSWSKEDLRQYSDSRDKPQRNVVQSGHFEHYAKWISTHSYNNNRWQIKSVEEKERDLLESSVRTSLLSDRSDGSKTKASVDDRDDDTYEFEANRWLAKDEGDRKLEVILQPKSNRLSSDTMNEHRADSRRKSATKSELRTVERSPRSYDVRGNRQTTSEPILRPRSPFDSSPHHSVRNRVYSSAYGTHEE